MPGVPWTLQASEGASINAPMGLYLSIRRAQQVFGSQGGSASWHGWILFARADNNGAMAQNPLRFDVDVGGLGNCDDVDRQDMVPEKRFCLPFSLGSFSREHGMHADGVYASCTFERTKACCCCYYLLLQPVVKKRCEEHEWTGAD